MDRDKMNNIVAKELSEALARCHQNGIDPGTVRTGLLTITIANFVNGIGLDNTIALFQALPQQIQSGLFDKFVDTTRPRSVPATKPYIPPVNPAAPPLPAVSVSPYGVSETGSPAPAEAAPPIQRRRL